MLGLAIGLLAIGKLTGLTDALDPEKIRTTVLEAGALGFLAFVVIFCLGELIHIPGMVFVGAALLIYGKAVGFAAAFVGAVISVCVSFVLVRAVGGKALTAFERPFLKKLLSKLDERPIRTVIFLRLLMWIAPPLNYALAMSNIRFREYAVGSATGLVLPILGLTMFFDVIRQFLEGRI